MSGDWQVVRVEILQDWNGTIKMAAVVKIYVKL